jgi:chorismate mutase
MAETGTMTVRGLRGAISVSDNTSEQILEATRELLVELLRANEITSYEDVISAIFTTTPDLTAAFPAEAARGVGMNQVPLLCASEIAVPHGMPKIIRILLHVNTARSQREVVHVYLRDARKLRPDVCSAQ